MDKPLNIKKFELEALRLKNLLDEKVIELPSAIGVNSKEISSRMNDLMGKGNVS